MIIRFIASSDTRMWSNQIYHAGCWSDDYPFIVSYFGKDCMSLVWGHLKISIVKEPNIRHSGCWSKNI